MKEVLFTDQTKTSSTSVPCHAMFVGQYLHLSNANTKPVNICEEVLTEAKKYLAGEAGEKLFNPSLMDKLIRIK